MRKPRPTSPGYCNLSKSICNNSTKATSVKLRAYSCLYQLTVVCIGHRAITVSYNLQFFYNSANCITHIAQITTGSIKKYFLKQYNGPIVQTAVNSNVSEYKLPNSSSWRNIARYLTTEFCFSRKNLQFQGSKYIWNRLKERKWTAILCRMGHMLRAETLF